MVMSWEERRSLGGKATAIKQKEIALKKYLESPKICAYCNSIIMPKGKERFSEVRKKKFCDSTCSAYYNNAKRISIRTDETKEEPCECCGKQLIRRINESKVKFKERRFCSRKCAIKMVKGWITGNPTKEHIFINGKNWQSSRSSIRKHATRVIRDSNVEMKCAECGYSNYVEICHIKSVSSFSKESRLEEINSLDNLVILCPNHHWEFDHGLLKL
jgi:hypothetical protein